MEASAALLGRNQAAWKSPLFRMCPQRQKPSARTRMEVETGTDAPSTGNCINGFVHIRPEVASMTERQVVNHIAVKQRSYVLRATPIIAALVVRILRECP